MTNPIPWQRLGELAERAADALAQIVEARRRHASEDREDDYMPPSRLTATLGQFAKALTPETVLQMAAEHAAVRKALMELVEIIDAAKLINLSRGVQLGPTVWFVKASERLEWARTVLGESAALTGGEP